MAKLNILGSVASTLLDKFSALAIKPREQTDVNGNIIIDMQVNPEAIKADWENKIESIQGVVSSGLFLNNYANQVWISGQDGSVDIYLPKTD